MNEISNSRRWTIVGLLFVAGFVNYLDRAILSVALPMIGADLKLGPEAKGVLLSAFFWSYALMQVPVGWVTDRYSLRWLYAGGFILWSTASGLTGFAGSLGMLLLLRVVLGIGESVYLPGGMKIVSLLFDSRSRGMASGLVNCGTRAGLALGAPFISWMIVSFAWRRTFFLIGLASLAWVAPWLVAFRGRAAVIPAAGTASGGHRFPWRDRNLLGLCLGQIGYSYYWYLLVTWLPDYLVESRRIPLERAGVYVMIPFLVFAISEPLGGWVADRFIRSGRNESKVRKSMISFSFAASFSLLLAGRMGDDVAAICLTGVSALVGLATGNILALLQSVAPREEVGLWTGILNFAGNLAGIGAPLITGILIGRTSSYFPGFAVAVALLIAALPAYWWMVGDPGAASLPGGRGGEHPTNRI